MADAFETILVTWLAFAFLPERPTRSQGGTDGSNPVSSSGESRANLISSIRALKFAKRDGVTPFSSLQQRVTCELELGRDACTRPHRRSRCQVGSEAEERRVKDSVLGLARSIETGAEQPFPSREIASSGR